MNEISLIDDIRQGNVHRYEELVKCHQQQVFRICMGFVHQREDAEDLAQEVFVKVYRSLHLFEGKSSFSTWLYRITINACLGHKRKYSKRGFSALLELFEGKEPVSMTETVTPEKLAETSELQRAIQKAVDTLPENQRIAFVLSKYDDLSQKEIASVMLLTEGAVESLLQRAKKNLQKLLVEFDHRK